MKVNQTSDRNDKTDIELLNDECLPLVKKLKPVTFRYNYRDYYRKDNPDPKYIKTYGLHEYDKEAHKAELKADKRTHVGFIAQDVKETLEELYPNSDKLDIVSIAGYTGNNYREELPDEDYRKYSMNYIGLIPILVKSIQEQQEEIEYLKGEIESLKNNKK